MRSTKPRRRTKPQRRRTALDNVVLDVRTARRLGKVLWRPLLSEMWSQRRQALRLGHR